MFSERRGFDAAVLPCGHLRRVLCCLGLRALVGVAGIFLGLWASVLRASSGSAVALFLVLVGSFGGLRACGRRSVAGRCGQRCGRLRAGVLLGRQVAPRSLGSGQMTQDLTEFDRQGQGKQKEHPISLRALNKTSRIG